MSKGFIYFAKNITGYKLGFTKIKINDAIKNLNTSQLIENFYLIGAITVNHPKKIKNEISKYLIDKKINKDLYNLSNNDIIHIFNLLNNEQNNRENILNKYVFSYVNS